MRNQHVIEVDICVLHDAQAHLPRDLFCRHTVAVHFNNESFDRVIFNIARKTDCEIRESTGSNPAFLAVDDPPICGALSRCCQATSDIRAMIGLRQGKAAKLLE